MPLSTDKIRDAVVAKIREMSPDIHGTYLDIGAGHGALARLVRREFTVTARACDYTKELMRTRHVPVDIVDLNSETLPYPDAAFDLVTCTEVIEHIEHYRQTIREIFRILKPDGVFVLTTPNVLNLRSRLRYLLFGFFNLFGPLHIRESDRFLTGGHINPVSYFYVAHTLSDAGFADITVATDKHQRGSFIGLVFLWAPIRLFSILAMHRERHRHKSLEESNEQFVRQMNSIDLLLGRTIIVGSRKKIT